MYCLQKLTLGMVTGVFCAVLTANTWADDRTVACAACHGADGNSLAPTFPKLAGQNEKYLLKQLREIKSGARAVPTMVGQLDAMSEQDLADIAAYYAGQPKTSGVANKELVALGESVYRSGILDKGVAACTACHSPNGSGNSAAGFPSLGGQHAEYTASTLRAFRTGARDNDGDTRMMRDVADRLSDKEIDALASYIAGLR